jgi:putative oxidoreductase
VSTSTISGFAPKMRSIMRIIVGFMFCQHGFQKMLGFFGGIGGTGRTAHFPMEAWFSGVLELVGGILILIGLCTPIIAFFLSGEMAVAFFTVHLPRSFWTVKNGGEPAVLYCFFFLYLVFAGAGPWSVDALLKKKSALPDA